MPARYGHKRKTPYPIVKRVRAALQALQLPDGTVKPYRPVPQDFAEVYIRMGWDGIDEPYGTNWRVIRRWIEISGRDRLIAARAAYVEKRRRERREQRRLSAVKAAQGRG